MTEELIAFASKQEMLAKSKQFWNPDKTQFWIDSGVPLVIDRREGYYIYDVEGKRLIDVHLNGGTYNLGHRNPEVAAAVTAAMQRFDIGNHHFPSLARTALAEALAATATPGLSKVMYGSGGGEAIDIALKSARHATKKRGIVSVAKAYHGHTGLAVATGDERFATLFLADRPDEFAHVPFNDLEAMEAALRGRDVAAARPGSRPRRASGSRPARGCCWRRSTWWCRRSRWPTRSCARCSAWSGCRRPDAGSRPPGRCCGCQGGATRPPSTAPTRA